QRRGGLGLRRRRWRRAVDGDLAVGLAVPAERVLDVRARPELLEPGRHVERGARAPVLDARWRCGERTAVTVQELEATGDDVSAVRRERERERTFAPRGRRLELDRRRVGVDLDRDRHGGLALAGARPELDSARLQVEEERRLEPAGVVARLLERFLAGL